MARKRRQGFLDLIAAMPWPAGVGLGLAAFFAIRYGVPWYFARPGNDLAMAFNSMTGRLGNRLVEAVSHNHAFRRESRVAC